MTPQLLGRVLVAVGVVAVLAGLLLLSGKLPFFPGRLPGDIRIERPNVRIYFPIMTCALISLVVTVVFWILSRFR